jgi:hypothetical protein
MSYEVTNQIQALDPTDYTRNDPIEGSAMVSKLVRNHNLATVAAGGALFRLGDTVMAKGSGAAQSDVWRVQLPEVPALRCTMLVYATPDTDPLEFACHLEELDGTTITYGTATASTGTPTAPVLVTVDLDITSGEREALLYFTASNLGIGGIVSAEVAPYPTDDAPEGLLDLGPLPLRLLDPAIPDTDLRALDIHTVDTLLDTPRRIEANRRGHLFHWQNLNPRGGFTWTAGPEQTILSLKARTTGAPLELWVRGRSGTSTLSSHTWTLTMGNGATCEVEHTSTTAIANPEDGWEHATIADLPAGVWDLTLTVKIVGAVDPYSVSILEVLA